MTITGPHSIVTHIVSPELDRTTTMTVASDNKTATYVSIDHRAGIAAALRTEYLARRTSPAPAGAHLVSGRWQGVRYVAVPAIVRTTTLGLVDGNFSYATPLGTSFTARLGGGYVPVQTASGTGVTVAVRRAGKLKIEERVKRNGTLVAIRTFTVTADGRAMEIATTDPSKGLTFRAISRHADRKR